MLFFSKRSSSVCSATTSFTCFKAQVLDFICCGRKGRVARKPSFPSFHEVLLPLVIDTLGNALTAA